jgi:ribosomal-protein-alanine N-acetyltransferase
VSLVTKFTSLQLSTVSLLELKPIASQMLSAVLELDDLCFGGLWTLEGYQRELDSPNGVLLGLFLGDSTGGGEQRGRGAEENVNFNSPLRPYTPAPLLSMGCFWAILDEAHITLLAVHPHYQHQGLGQAMLLALMAEACDRGLERATLEVRASNVPALSLYRKFGFKIAGRRRGYYKDTNEDALILWRGDLQDPQFQTALTSWYQFVGDRLEASGWNFHLPQIICN